MFALGDHRLPYDVVHTTLKVRGGSEQVARCGVRLDRYGIRYGVGQLTKRQGQGHAGLVARRQPVRLG